MTLKPGLSGLGIGSWRMLKKEWLVSADLLSGLLAKNGSAEVSVVIPCFAAAATIGRALASVEAQTCKPFEVIVVDDASPDATRNQLQELVEKYGSDWLKVHFLAENCGPALARNYGWERATQPFVAFLDADDSWHRDKIALQLAFMLQNPEIFISGHSCGGVTNLVRKLPQKFKVAPYTLRQLLFCNRLQTPTVMLKREIILHFPAGIRFAEDYYLWLALVKIGYQVASIDLELAAIHKPAFGFSGQSAALWQMEKGELKAIRAAFNRGSVSSVQYATAVGWSLLKYIRRVLLSSGSI